MSGDIDGIMPLMVEDTPASNRGSRGKSAESILAKLFAQLTNERHDTCFERIPDARSSRGASSNPQAGDFCIYTQGRNILVECKEVDHKYRLPCANYPLDQRARGRKRLLAGSEVWTLVYFTPLGEWRLAPHSYFGLQEKGSWDMSALPLYKSVEINGLLLQGYPVCES